MYPISRKATSNSALSIEMNGDGSECKISPELIIKHPLQDQWTLWYLENDRTKSWEDMQNKVTSFHTVEDFWSLYNHIKDPSILGEGNDYSLFKKNIQPMWEDPANKSGGRWILNNKQHRRNELDELWLDTMLYIIGGTSAYRSDINGAVINIRQRGDKISLWTADWQNTNAITGTGREIKQYLRWDQKIYYEMHNTTSKSAKHLLVL